MATDRTRSRSGGGGAAQQPQDPREPGDRQQPGGLVLAPFRGLRYSAAACPDLAPVTAPPYDLIDDDRARALRSAHPYNVVRLIRDSAGDAPAAGDYQGVASLLRRWRSERVLVTDEEPALYVYEQRHGSEVTQRGLIGGLRLAPPEAGVVLPHEDTMPGPVEDRLRLMRATSANLEPIFLLYEGGGAASALVDDVADTRKDDGAATTGAGEAHRIWRVTDPREHARVVADLRERSALIADGHHRYATYLRYQGEQYAASHGQGAWDYGLALLVDSAAYPPTLSAVHRVVTGMRPEAALRAASGAFRVARLPDSVDAATEALTAASTSTNPGPAFVITGNGRYHLLHSPDPQLLARTMPAQRSATWRALPTAILSFLLIPVLWGLDEDESVTYQHDARTAGAVAERSGGTAVLVPPIQASAVFELARGGERVPRKSTSFGPKPRTGLVMRLLAGQQG